MLQWDPLGPMGPEHIQFIMCAYNYEKIAFGALTGVRRKWGLSGLFYFCEAEAFWPFVWIHLVRWQMEILYVKTDF